MSDSLIKAAQCLVDESVDLKRLPESKLKSEFLKLAEDALHDRLNGIMKARLEYLSDQMLVQWERFTSQEERQKLRAQADLNRAKQERKRKMLSHRTPKGQPVLKGLAKIQLEEIEEMIAREKLGK